MVKLRYPFATIEKFIKDKVGDYRITTDGEIAINSPLMDDTTYDCRISVDKQCWHDWESDEGGPIDSLIAIIADIESNEVPNLMMKYGAAEFKEKERRPNQPLVVDVEPIKLPPGSHTFDQRNSGTSLYNANIARKFLASKMVNYKLAKKYDLRWTELSFLHISKEKKINLSNRIIIPSYENGSLVYYQARDYTEKSMLRYKNPPKSVQPKGIIVPFYDQLIEKQPLFISEGPWEAIQYSGTYMLGPSLSDRQIYKLKSKRPTAVYFIPDNDATGRTKLLKNITTVQRFLDVPIYIIKWWEGKDEFKDPIEAGITADGLLRSTIVAADRNIELKLKMGMI